MVWLETLLNGVMLGALYALFGLGLALIFGVMRIANIAHGELVVGGAFLLLVAGHAVPINPLWLAAPVAVAMFGAGWLLQAALVNRVLGPDPLPPLLLTFGVSVVLQNLFVELFGADIRGVDAGAIEVASLAIGPVSIGVLPLLILATAVMLFAVVQTVLSRTGFGRVARATADDPEIVQLMAVDRKRVFATIMGLAVALSALAGALLAVRTSFSPFSGVERLLIAFEVVVIGGLGSIWGALVGGVAIGVVQIIGLSIDPEGGLLYGHLLLLAILFLRPEGIAGSRAAR